MSAPRTISSASRIGRFGFRAGQARHVIARIFARGADLFDGAGADGELESGRRQQFAAARGLGGENQIRHV